MGKDFNKYYNIQEIQNHLKSINLFDQKELVHFSDDNLMELKNAFYFLNQENLVAWNDNRNIIITYKGYIKIKTNGFEKEINKWLQRIAWTIPIIISTTALLVSIFK